MTKLFQAFSQIDSSLARKFEGTGLGLAMVKRLAELHGGTVAVASAEEEGSCFAVWLPIRAVTSVVEKLQSGLDYRASNAPPETLVALVVEDNDHAADLARLLLEAEGFTVLVASSAEQALYLATQQPLSLITIDLALPGIDGWEFLLRIREIDSLAQVPVVIIASMIDGNMALASGAAAVLQKPISRAELSASLVRLGLAPANFVTRTVLVVDDDPKAVEVHRHLPARLRVHRGAGLRGGRGDHIGRTTAARRDPAGPDDARYQRFRRGRGAAAQSRHRSHPDHHRDSEVDHGGRPFRAQQRLRNGARDRGERLRSTASTFWPACNAPSGIPAGRP